MYQVSFNYLIYFQRYAPTEFNIAKIRNENNSVNTDNRVMYFTFFSSPQGPLSLFQVTFIYLQYFQKYASDKLTIAKVRKGNNSVIICDRGTVNALCTSKNGRLSMYQVSFNSLLRFQKYAPVELSIAKIKNGGNFVNIGDNVMALAFCSFPHGSLLVYVATLYCL